MKVLIFDTETTGLIKNRTVPITIQPEVIEFYGCIFDLDKGEVVVKNKKPAELEFLFRPKKPISDVITKITGLTDEKVCNSPRFAEKAAIIKKFLESAAFVIAHNASFDKEMIDIEMDRCGMKVEWPTLICTVEQTTHIKGHRLNLGALYQHLIGEPFVGAHRAKADVMALGRCCKKMHELEML